MMKIFLLLAVVAFASAANKLRYDNYKVFRITPQTDEQAAFLAGLEDKGIRFWDGPSNKAGRANDMMFPPHMQGDLLDYIRSSGMIVEDFVDNVQNLMDNEVVSYQISPKLTWDAYHPYATIQAWLTEQTAGKPHVKLDVLGKSYQGRDIMYVEFQRNASNPWVWIDANIHAREWITNTIATYLLDKFLNDPQYYETYLKHFNWVIVPMLNPDGYEYSRATDRMWRKTRRPNAGSSCAGTDANRNFGFHWMEGGASANPCSETYGGDEAFSEPETAAARDFMEQREWAFYMSLHSYSQLILLSYGLNRPGTNQPWKHPDHENLLRIGNAAAAAHRVRYGTNFRAGNIVELLYVASGGSMDWALGAHNVPLGVTYEMRDQGQFGFILPPNQILPSCQEWMDGFQVYYNELMAKHHPDVPTNKF